MKDDINHALFNAFYYETSSKIAKPLKCYREQSKLISILYKIKWIHSRKEYVTVLRFKTLVNLRYPLVDFLAILFLDHPICAFDLPY